MRIELSRPHTGRSRVESQGLGYYYTAGRPQFLGQNADQEAASMFAGLNKTLVWGLVIGGVVAWWMRR